MAWGRCRLTVVRMHSKGGFHVYPAKAARKLKVFDDGENISLNNHFGGYASLCEELFDQGGNLFD